MKLKLAILSMVVVMVMITSVTAADITICQVQHNGDYNPDLGSLDKLVSEINSRTTHITENGGWVNLNSLDAMCECDMLYITGHYSFSFTDTQRENLKAYLDECGIMFADDCSQHSDNEGFETSFRNEMQIIFGESLTDLPSNHEVFSSFYNTGGTLPTEWNNEPLQGITDGDGRTVVIYSDNDYGCGWENSASAGTIENSYKMGVNIAVYAHNNCVDSDGDRICDLCDICPNDPENDADGDGICGDVDYCADTIIPEDVPTVGLRPFRFALVDNDGVFDTVGTCRYGYTIWDTQGCSCSQIIDKLGLGKGHRYYGCSVGIMNQFVSMLEGR